MLVSAADDPGVPGDSLQAETIVSGLNQPTSIEFSPDGRNLYISEKSGVVRVRRDGNLLSTPFIDISDQVNNVRDRGLLDIAIHPDFDSDANRSKVYQYGLRNPFRLAVDSATGELFVGDVCWMRDEEVNSAGAGANFGWPYFEGGNGTPIRTPSYENLPEAQAFYASGQQTTPSVFALSHQEDGINAIVMGDVYRGTTYPAEFQGNLFVNDLGQGIVRAISFDSAGNVDQVRTFTTGAQIVVQMVQGPDGNMYYVDLNDNTVGRWVFS